MIQAFLSIILVFPASFIFYALSERAIAKHESRVGREILIGNFFVQTWFDSWEDLKSHRSLIYWFIFTLQCSIVFLFEIDVEYLLFIYLALNAIALVCLSPANHDAIAKIEADRNEVKYALSTTISLLCIFCCFTLSKSTSLVQIHWSWIEVFFVVPFQLAGMILFGEQPFQGMSAKPMWTESLRFYIWSMLCVQLFMGGGFLLVDLHLKAAIIYWAFRVAGIYFPRFQQRDLLRIGILYLFPLTGLLWLAVMLYGGISV